MSSFKLGGGNSQIFNFHPDPWGNDPIWLTNIFQMGWNHQLDGVFKRKPKLGVVDEKKGGMGMRRKGF